MSALFLINFSSSSFLCVFLPSKSDWTGLDWTGVSQSCLDFEGVYSFEVLSYKKYNQSNKHSAFVAIIVDFVFCWVVFLKKNTWNIMILALQRVYLITQKWHECTAENSSLEMQFLNVTFAL